MFGGNAFGAGTFGGSDHVSASAPSPPVVSRGLVRRRLGVGLGLCVAFFLIAIFQEANHA